mmetsp:Transcript_18328/g.42413  ORF Transcript_18328/g.42413 Transcript_18328/m.42413 type:complete len:558 (+) Transcript_18328:109-1782(+)
MTFEQPLDMLPTDQSRKSLLTANYIRTTHQEQSSSAATLAHCKTSDCGLGFPFSLRSLAQGCGKRWRGALVESRTIIVPLEVLLSKECDPANQPHATKSADDDADNRTDRQTAPPRVAVGFVLQLKGQQGTPAAVAGRDARSAPGRRVEALVLLHICRHWRRERRGGLCVLGAQGLPLVFSLVQPMHVVDGVLPPSGHHPHDGEGEVDLQRRSEHDGQCLTHRLGSRRKGAGRRDVRGVGGPELHLLVGTHSTQRNIDCRARREHHLHLCLLTSSRVQHARRHRFRTGVHPDRRRPPRQGDVCLTRQGDGVTTHWKAYYWDCGGRSRCGGGVWGGRDRRRGGGGRSRERHCLPVGVEVDGDVCLAAVGTGEAVVTLRIFRHGHLKGQPVCAARELDKVHDSVLGAHLRHGRVDADLHIVQSRHREPRPHLLSDDGAVCVLDDSVRRAVGQVAAVRGQQEPARVCTDWHHLVELGIDTRAARGTRGAFTRRVGTVESDLGLALDKSPAGQRVRVEGKDDLCAPTPLGLLLTAQLAQEGDPARPGVELAEDLRLELRSN